MDLFFSIIIPVKAINEYVYENISHIKLLSQENWEVFIVTNEVEENPWKEEKNIFLLSSGRVGPGAKRDLAAQTARGDVLVFLDDDSYPIKGYLNVAQNEFLDNKIIAIGGPGITPESNGLIQKISGCTFFSKLSGGAPERYLSISTKKIVKEWPSVNIAIRKEAFKKVGGFNTCIWPGEDTVLCSKLTEAFGPSINYVPNLIVYHHRRGSILDHLIQVFSYGRQRGYLFRKRDLSSNSLRYVLPSFFFLFVLLQPGMLFFELQLINTTLKILWMCYFMVVCKIFYDILQYSSTGISIAATCLSIFNHFFYGFGFLIGLMSPRPKIFLR